MRILLTAPLILLGACSASTDANNDSVTLDYDPAAAQNTVADVSNTAENIGAAIANDVDETADKVGNSDIVADDDTGNAAANTTDNHQ